jgi:hypothetical protein
MGAKRVRTICAMRARTKIGLHPLTCNMKRLGRLVPMKAAVMDYSNETNKISGDPLV